MDRYEFEASLVYMANSSPAKATQQKKKKEKKKANNGDDDEIGNDS